MWSESRKEKCASFLFFGPLLAQEPSKLGPKEAELLWSFTNFIWCLIIYRSSFLSLFKGQMSPSTLLLIWKGELCLFCLMILVWLLLPCYNPQLVNYFKEGNPHRLWGAMGMARKWCTFSKASKGATPVIVQRGQGWRQETGDWTTLIDMACFGGQMHHFGAILCLSSFGSIWWSFQLSLTLQWKFRSASKFQGWLLGSCILQRYKDCLGMRHMTFAL